MKIEVALIGFVIKSLIIVCTFLVVIPAEAGIQVFRDNGCPIAVLGHDGQRLTVCEYYFETVNKIEEKNVSI